MADTENIRYEEEFTLNSRGIQLFTCRWLPTKVEPKALIFLCHGYAMECSITLNSTAMRLAMAGFAVYGMDYQGHGKSAGLQAYITSFDDIIDDVTYHYTNVCEKKENRQKMRFLLGESMGGAVILLLHRKKPEFWHGAVLVAPMCKIAEHIRPNPFVIRILTKLSKIIPTWKIVPSSDIIDSSFKEPEIRKQARPGRRSLLMPRGFAAAESLKIRENPYCYKDRPRLMTAYELLQVSLDLEKRLHEVSIPFIVLHGGDDMVTDLEVSKQLYEVASSSDKTLKMYPGMWHGLLYGEPPENTEIVISDIVSWLEDRAPEINQKVEREHKIKNDDRKQKGTMA